MRSLSLATGASRVTRRTRAVAAERRTAFGRGLRRAGAANASLGNSAG